MNEAPKIQKIAFIGDHLPRKCGIATFTSDLLAAVQRAHTGSRCLAVSVNDIPDGYEYPDVVRFEIEEQDLSSYLRAADFLNSATWTWCACNTNSESSAGPPVVKFWRFCANCECPSSPRFIRSA